MIFVCVEHSDKLDSMYLEFMVNEEKVGKKVKKLTWSNNLNKSSHCQKCQNIHLNIYPIPCDRSVAFKCKIQEACDAKIDSRQQAQPQHFKANMEQRQKMIKKRDPILILPPLSQFVNSGADTK